MCQGCVNNGCLTQETFDLINEFCELCPWAKFGPAHIVLGDCNIEDCHSYGVCLLLMQSLTVIKMDVMMMLSKCWRHVHGIMIMTKRNW